MNKALARLYKQVAELLPPPDELTISEWAERYAYLPQEGNAEPGKFHLARMPYEIAMLDDPLDPAAIETYWMIGSQLGKTLCIIIIIEYHIDHAPSSILVVYPTLDSAKSWMREKFIPTTKETPRLKGKLKEPRAKDSESTTLNRKFIGGNLTASGANSVSGLRQRSKRIIILDEIDAMEVTAEGDPIALADKRAETFHDAIKLKSSTPTKKETSRIEEGYERSDKQLYFLPCWNCGGFMALESERFKFSFPQPDGTEKRDTENAVFECEHCKAHWTDQHRLAAIASGHKDNAPVIVVGKELRAEWRATAAFTGVRGRRLPGWYQVIGKKKAFKNFHHQFAENFLEAKHKGAQTLEVWTNTFEAKTFEPAAEQVDWMPLLNRCEDYGGDMPDDVCLLIAAADVQKDRVEIEVVGWGEEEESWGIEKAVIFGDFDLPVTQQSVDDFLLKKWKHPSGVELGITATAIDSGHKTKAVYGFVRKRVARRIYAVKGGSEGEGMPLVTTRAHKHYRIQLHTVGTDTAKVSLFDRMKVAEEGARYMHFPKGRGYTESYFKQLCSEKLQTYLERGVKRRRWVKRFERNEALDLRVYGLAALDILKPNIARIRQSISPKDTTEYELKPASTLEATTPKPQPRPSFNAPARRPGGWVGGWR